MFLNRLILSQVWRSLTSILNPVACFKFLFGESLCQRKEFVTLVTWYFFHVNMLRGLWLRCCGDVWKVIYFLLNLETQGYLPWGYKEMCRGRKQGAALSEYRNIFTYIEMETFRIFRWRRTHSIAFQWHLSLPSLKA